MGAHERTLTFKTEAETAAFSHRVAPMLEPGDCLLLAGQIGAGKTFFARQIIRALTTPEEEVPSPTFTLVQTYSTPDFDIWHCDLYRLSHPEEAFELGLDDAFATSVVLIEWPDRLGDLTPATALILRFSAPEPGVRQVTADGPAARWHPILELFDA